MFREFERGGFLEKHYFRNEAGRQDFGVEDPVLDAMNQASEKAARLKVEKVLAETAPIPEKLHEFAITIQSFIDRRNAEMGIDRRQMWSRHIRFANNPEHLGSASLDMITISDLARQDIDLRAELGPAKLPPLAIPTDILEGHSPDVAASLVREYLEAKVLAHELYHDSGRSTESYQVDKVGALKKLYDEVQGLAYFNDLEAPVGDGDGPALEEGLAVVFESDVAAQLVRESFPEGARLHDLLVTYATREFGDALPDKLVDHLTLKNFDGGKARFGFTPYYSSYQLVTFLSTRIPNFEVLVEQARVANKPLNLFREIKSQYGVGVGRVLMQIRNHSAGDILRGLQDLDRANQYGAR